MATGPIWDMRAWFLACLACLAHAEINVDVEMLVPAEVGLNLSQFVQNLKTWTPSVNETLNSTNTTNSNSTSPPQIGFFSPFNIRLALTGLNNVLCVSGLNLTQCHTDQPKPAPTPTPTPEPPPVEVKAAQGGVDAVLAAGIACASLGVVSILAVYLCSKRKAATRLVMRCIIRETIDWPPKKIVAQWPRGPQGSPSPSPPCP
jgi:hypothetical protein